MTLAINARIFLGYTLLAIGIALLAVGGLR